MDRWTNFCLVGFGRHAKNHLVPAIRKNGQKLIGVVSSHAKETEIAPKKLFRDIDDALESLPKDTCFLVASSPMEHSKTICKIVKSGFDLMVEKPAFVKHSEAIEAIELIELNEVVFVEAFMFKHSLLFNKAMEYWGQYRDDIQELKISFLIPDLPRGTFRDDEALESSIIFDIGCYGITLLADFEVPMGDLRVRNLQANGGRLSYVQLYLEGECRVFMEFGFGYPYRNSLELVLKEQRKLQFAPFFYGREGERRIEKIGLKDGRNVLSFHEDTVFSKMFATKISDWKASQHSRLKNLEDSIRCLESISSQLSKRMRNAN